MDDEILKQVIRAALDGTKPPELSKQETDVYIRTLFVRGITAIAAYQNANGVQTVVKVSIPNRSPETVAKLEEILNS
jgi:hypothetical protein